MFVLVSGKINKKNLERSSPFQSCGRRLSVIHLLYSFPSCCLGRCLSVIYPHLGWRAATEQGKGPRAKYSDCCCSWQVFIYYYATLIDFPNSLFFYPMLTVNFVSLCFSHSVEFLSSLVHHNVHFDKLIRILLFSYFSNLSISSNISFSWCI